MVDNTSLVKIDAAPLVTRKPTSTALTLGSTGTAAFGPEAGPANPFKANDLKRKNVPTGHAQEVALSDYTFRAAQQAYGKPTPGASLPLAKRQKRGDASIVDGAGSYKGPWARYEREDMVEDRDVRAGDEDRSLASDEEYVEVYEDEELDAYGNVLVTATPAVSAPMPKASTGYADDSTANESTQFHGEKERDYQGRTYMHIPQDLDIDLKKEPGSTKNFIPKKQIHTWRGHTKAITALRFFPTSGHLLLSSSADSKVKIWDCYHSRELLRTYSGHNKSVSDVVFTPDGVDLLTASFDKQMKLWDTETGQCKGRFTTGKTPHVIKFNPSQPHEFLAGMSDKKIVQFDVRSGELIQEYDHHLGPINTITFVDEDRRFITTSDDKSLRAWEYGIPVPIKFVAEPYMFAMSNAAPHPSGKYVAFQSGDNQIVVYAASDRFRQNRKKSYRGHNNAGYAIDLSVSPDGQFLMSGDSGGYVCVWDWKTCKMYEKWVASEGPVVACQWHPQESSKVATAGLDGSIKYWD